VQPGAAADRQDQRERGELVKRPFGPWVRTPSRVLATAEGPARHGASTSFGRTAERRTERALVWPTTGPASRGCCTASAAGNVAQAAEIARIPEGDPRLRPREGAPSCTAARARRDAADGGRGAGAPAGPRALAPVTGPPPAPASPPDGWSACRGPHSAGGGRARGLGGRSRTCRALAAWTAVGGAA
jgi:hypothetical protein